jgi:hypothetical protein
MLYIYLSCAVLLILILIFYYKFTQNKKEQEKLLKMMAEKSTEQTKELKDFQDFVLNGFQHLSKDIEKKSQSTDDVPLPEQDIEMENFEINDELPTDLKEKINSLNSDKDNEFDSEVNVSEPLEVPDQVLEEGSESHASSVEEDADGSVEEDADGSVEEDADGSVEEDADGSVEEDADGSVEEDADGSVEEDADGSSDEEDAIQINNPSLELLTLKELQEIARTNNLAIRGPKKDLILRIKNNNN